MLCSSRETGPLFSKVSSQTHEQVKEDEDIPLAGLMSGYRLESGLPFVSIVVGFAIQLRLSRLSPCSQERHVRDIQRDNGSGL
jgi:hypothetical protein